MVIMEGFLMPYSLEPMVGLEPTTCCLRNSCSTTELHRQCTIYIPIYPKYCSIGLTRAQLACMPATWRLQCRIFRHLHALNERSGYHSKSAKAHWTANLATRIYASYNLHHQALHIVRPTNRALVAVYLGHQLWYLPGHIITRAHKLNNSLTTP
jgi:hypothetical protein